MATIDLNRIGVFVRVVEQKSFTGAAQELRVPVSSVSRAISGLEDELGVRLLHRTTRKLSLTDAGQHFFGRMQAVVNEAEQATRAITGFASEPRGVVRITTPPDLGAQELPRVIAKIARQHPGLSIELKLTNHVVDIVAEGFDLAVRGGNLGDSSLVARKIADSEMGIYGSPAYLQHRGRPRALSDLKKHACLRYGARDIYMPWRFTGPRGEESVTVNGPIVCDDLIFLREAAIDGAGLTILPVHMATPSVRAKRLARVLPSHRLTGGTLSLMWPSRKLVPAHVVVVRELLLQELAQIFS
jgi:DNA-binding transcriptional LysR family regulator